MEHKTEPANTGVFQSRYIGKKTIRLDSTEYKEYQPTYEKQLTKELPESIDVYTFAVSTDDVDRIADKILVSGIDTSEYMQNPQVLRNHSGLTIGNTLRIYVEDGKLFADAWFDEVEQSSVNTKRQLDLGTINKASIGFEILETESQPMNEIETLRFKGTWYEDQPIRVITRSRLVEWSVVDIPANISAERVKGLAKKQFEAIEDAKKHVQTLSKDEIKSICFDKINIIEESYRLNTEQIKQIINI